MKLKGMYEYYSEKELYVHGNTKSREDLDAHKSSREDLFTNKLSLPPMAFKNSNLIEFGPATGENSLVFAEWGANCTLQEPNIKAHQAIRNNFARFDLLNNLIGLEGYDVEGYAKQVMPDKRYDIIDAEGFIYTIKPENIWMDLFTRILKPKGFLILYESEAFGSCPEIMLKVMFTRVCEFSKLDPIEVGKRLFKEKWGTVPHTRRIDAWIEDAMENPFVRLKYFIEAKEFCAKMMGAGYSLYSSWPLYKNGLAVHWSKKILKPVEQLEEQNQFICRNRLSYMFGRPHFLTEYDPEFEKSLVEFIARLDSLIDNYDSDKAELCIEGLDTASKKIESNKVLSGEDDKRITLGYIEGMKHAFKMLSKCKTEEIVDFCNTNQPFIKTWGTPSHFMVFQKNRG